ncbi:DUF934 domain-containing protein [Oricola cellulosilytica]|uniref:DUF934 domain-containing protein n=1 Tax=Oricola cellulosilytica TaxID=1429082 RepID=A0A4R0PBB1_9HYPH|nr:DUF934 domain-containing protein [Oricola cellulosilytica]TCD13510.1 DUF934 domain-containing protein [Oricola cellulosilytica]
MGIIVTDSGFQEDSLAIASASGDFRMLGLDELQQSDESAPPGKVGLAVDNSVDTETLVPFFERVSVIAIPFPSFPDGRGFSIARELRQLGYKGTLRATGHLIADQYAHARRTGFDEVEISPELAARQPEEQWTARADWQNHFYQKRLLGER